jgi:hypothetical protein
MCKKYYFVIIKENMEPMMIIGIIVVLAVGYFMMSGDEKVVTQPNVSLDVVVTSKQTTDRDGLPIEPETPSSSSDSVDNVKAVLTPIDCDVSDWSKWNDCTKSCGGGTQSRFRVVRTHAADGGVTCPTELNQSRECNTQTCELSITEKIKAILSNPLVDYKYPSDHVSLPEDINGRKGYKYGCGGDDMCVSKLLNMASDWKNKGATRYQRAKIYKCMSDASDISELQSKCGHLLDTWMPLYNKIKELYDDDTVVKQTVEHYMWQHHNLYQNCSDRFEAEKIWHRVVSCIMSLPKGVPPTVAGNCVDYHFRNGLSGANGITACKKWE